VRTTFFLGCGVVDIVFDLHDVGSSARISMADSPGTAEWTRSGPLQGVDHEILPAGRTYVLEITSVASGTGPSGPQGHVDIVNTAATYYRWYCGASAGTETCDEYQHTGADPSGGTRDYSAVTTPGSNPDPAVWSCSLNPSMANWGPNPPPPGSPNWNCVTHYGSSAQSPPPPDRQP